MLDLKQNETIKQKGSGLVRWVHPYGRYSVLATVNTNDPFQDPMDVTVLGPGRCHVRINGRNAYSNAHIIAKQLAQDASPE